MKIKNGNKLFGLLVIFFVQFTVCQNNGKVLLFVGSYTDGKPGDGIHVYTFDADDGRLSELYKQDDVVNTSYLALSNDGKYLYAVSESKLEENGSVSAFALDSIRGGLTFLNKQSTQGRNPAHLNVHDSDRFLVSANYTDAVVNLYEVDTDGSLKPAEQHIELTGSSIVPGSQDVARAHSSNFSPDNSFLYVMDLGSDKIRAFSFNESKTPKLLAEEDKGHTSVAGSGPRHFAFHPNGKFGYCINELNGTITSFAYKDGHLNAIGNDFSYSEPQENYKAADIQVSGDGKFLYASNRGENTLSIFRINGHNGSLTLVGHESTYGDHPRSFVIDPSDRYLLVANQITGNIVVFERNRETGDLEKIDQEIQLKAPSCLKMRKYALR